MILEAILDLLFVVPELILSVFPTVEMSGISLDMASTSHTWIEVFGILFANIAYVFPVKQCFPLLMFSITMNLAHFVWAIALRIKSFIPTMGS